MNKLGVLIALENGEFDGVNHVYELYDDYDKNTSYKVNMKVIGREIKITRIYKNNFIDEKEVNFGTSKTIEILSKRFAVDFIEKKPHCFKKIRPDLF